MFPLESIDSVVKMFCNFIFILGMCLVCYIGDLHSIKLHSLYYNIMMNVRNIIYDILMMNYSGSLEVILYTLECDRPFSLFFFFLVPIVIVYV